MTMEKGCKNCKSILKLLSFSTSSQNLRRTDESILDAQWRINDKYLDVKYESSLEKT